MAESGTVPASARPRVAKWSMVMLALRLLARNWRSGELRVLLAALVVAAAASSAVAFVGDRALSLLQGQGRDLLAADRVLLSSNPIAEAWVERAHEMGLRSARTLEFPTMLQADNGARLVELKAVSASYPLRGRLRAADGASQPPRATTVWLEPALANSLGLAVGAAVQVGDANLQVAALLESEPDRSSRFFSIGPRLLMNLADIPASGLLQPYSRVRHRLLLAGPPAALSAYQDWLEPQLDGQTSIIGVEDARPAVRSALERASRFLALAGMVAVLLAAVAVGLAARGYSRRNLDLGAMLRCLGASRAQVLVLIVVQTLCIGLLAGLIGVVIGYVVQYLLADLLAALATTPVPAPGLKPWLVGIAVSLLTLLAFALPSLLAISRVAVMRVLRRDQDVGIGHPVLLWLPGLLWLLGLLWWQAGDVALGAWVVLGSVATVTLLALGAWLLVLAVERLRRRLRPGSGGGWRLGLANLARRPGASTTQIVGYGLGIMALLLLTVVRGDLFRAWQDQLPLDAPNRFVIGIRDHQVEALGEFLSGHDVAVPRFYPMVRGRLVAINDRPVVLEEFAAGRARRLLAREFNLSHAALLPAHNRVDSGRWWQGAAAGEALLSVESGIAKALGIGLGDSLRFSVLGQNYQGRVSNLRTVAWDSFQVNFFVIATPALLGEVSTGLISSFHLPDGREALLDTLVQRFPNLTIIDVGVVIEQVRAIMDRVAAVLAWVFGFTLAAGVVLMLASIGLTRAERGHELAVLRTLGARRGQLRAALLMEFAALGAVAGLIGALGAGWGGWLLAGQVLGLDYQPGWVVWLGGPLLAVVVIALVGWLGVRDLLDRPPREMLASG